MENMNIPTTHQEKKAASAPTLAETTAFIAAGYDVDTQGRPLHPRLSDMGTDTPTGKGAYWGWGPNFTADPVVITTETRPRILLIHRADTGDLALPGGFLDAAEIKDPIQAAYRELEEETGLIVSNEGTLLYQGVVDDPRATANAWPETFAYLFTVPEPLPVQAGDDAREADWYYIDQLPKTIYGSHAELIQKALEARRPSSRTIQEILAVPSEETQTRHINAGHMAYEHLFIQHQGDHLFVKAHDSSRFTDAFREAHSRTYLQKEYSLYRYLELQQFGFIPKRVALIDDTLLAMDALHKDDGWQWRAPKQPESFEAYVSDTLKAFNKLQSTPPPEKPEYHASIKDTYSTLWEEGWDSIDDQSLQSIESKIRQFSRNWSAEQYKLSEALITALPAIKQKSLDLARDQELFMAHNDARQSNIAWHPQYGTRLVDWSWGDTAPKNADSTMFLIDLVKSGQEIDTHLASFNPAYAHTLVGFWLAHSLWQTRDNSQTVREHQVASAVAAYKLLSKEH